jgi:hypothetical protein
MMSRQPPEEAKSQKPLIVFEVDETTDDARESGDGFSLCCLPFGGFCGFPFHLDTPLNDTHLLNMF